MPPMRETYNTGVVPQAYLSEHCGVGAVNSQSPSPRQRDADFPGNMTQYPDATLLKSAETLGGHTYSGHYP